MQRDLYEVRERRSEAYSRKVFMLIDIMVEIPWDSLMADVILFTWYWRLNSTRTHAMPFASEVAFHKVRGSSLAF